MEMLSGKIGKKAGYLSPAVLGVLSELEEDSSELQIEAKKG